VQADSPVTRQTGRAARPAGLRPLRRRPKQLDAEPELFEARAGGAGGLVLAGSRDRDRGRRGGGGPGSGAPGVTGEPAQLLDEAPASGEPDRETLRRARQIAARLAVPRPRRDITARRGVGELASVRYRGGSDDIDLDATLDNLVEHPFPEDDDIIVRERVRTRRSVVLAVDVSGSMRGERVRTAAATVGALAGQLDRDDLAVIAFWSDAAVLARLGQHVPAGRLLDTLLRIPARGLTNIWFPLQIARRQLAAIPARDARVLLLSDCVHNAGPDPRQAAAGLARLDVLLDASGEHDEELARDLARLGRGRLARTVGYRDVAPAVSGLFAQ
jgi:Mg-chelatase subunit ChlD